MRLASLARKIKITPSKINEFASAQGFDLAQGSNTKLTSEQVEIILNEFNTSIPETEPLEVLEEQDVIIVENSPVVEEKIHEVEEIEVPESAEAEAESAENIVTGVNEDVTTEVEKKEEVVDAKSPVSSDDEELTEEEVPNYESVEVIKAPKIKLQGLTVKGKIDLPEPKPKETEVAENTSKAKEPKVSPDGIIYTQGPDRKPRKSAQQKQNEKRRKKKVQANPIEAERKRQEKRAEKEKKQKIEAQKRAKAAHYKQAVKKKKKLPTQVNEVTPEKTEMIVPKKVKRNNHVKKEIPTNVFSRFWRWMNT